MNLLLMMLFGCMAAVNLAMGQLRVDTGKEDSLTTVEYDATHSYSASTTLPYTTDTIGGVGDLFGAFATRIPLPPVTVSASFPQATSTSFITTIHTWTVITITDDSPAPADELTSISTRYVATVLTRCSTEPHTTNAADQMTVKEKVDCDVYSTLPTTDSSSTTANENTASETASASTANETADANTASETASANTTSTSADSTSSTHSVDIKTNATSIRPTSTVTKFTTASGHHFTSSLASTSTAGDVLGSDGQEMFGQPAAFGGMLSLAIVIAWAARVF